jgi:addiction module RelB/DinJ family antitoxin
MSVLFRCRVEPDVLAKADAVTASLGTKTSEMVRMFLAQIARTGKVPVSLDAAPEEDLLNRPARNRILASLDDTQDW